MGLKGGQPVTDLSIEKPFPLPPDRVFDLVTAPAHLPSWWGPEGITLGEYQLDFTRPGPWFSVMIEPESDGHRVSGAVLHVTPGKAVELTWRGMIAKVAGADMKAWSACPSAQTAMVAPSSACTRPALRMLNRHGSTIKAGPRH